MNKREFIYNRIIGLIIISIMLLIYFNYGQINIAIGPSMKPTIIDGERIFINKKSYSLDGPEVNDVIYFKSPKDGLSLIKRVVARQGDRVVTNNEGVRINEKLLNNSTGYGDLANYTLKNEEYFVLGDNRVDSDDSRDFGPIGNENILGKVIFVIWPPSQWRFIK